MITDWAGMECTREFEIAGHSSEALKDLKKLKVGVLRKSEPIMTEKPQILDSVQWTAPPEKKQYKRRSCFLFC